MRVKKILASLIVIQILAIFVTPVIERVDAVDSVIEVNGWADLKEKIESQDKENKKIKLVQSQNWEASTTIEISTNQQIEILADEEITIKRNENFKNNLIENKGTLVLGNDQMNGKIVFDGNKESATADNALVVSESGNIEIGKNVIFQNNHSTKDGAGLILKKSVANINGVEFKNNISNRYGGGIYCEASELTATNFKLLNNSGTYGGGMYISDNFTTAVLNNIEVKENNATVGSGGGIYAYGKITVSGDDTIISNNTAQTFRRWNDDKN